MNYIESEAQAIEYIHKYFPNTHESISLGRGDDCALLDTSLISGKIAITTDIFCEHIHFRKKYFPMKAIGYKALAINISDICAMGAKPFAFQLGLMLPPYFLLQDLEDMLAGMADLANTYHIFLSGGDLSEGKELALTITLLGKADSQVRLFRGEGKIGDKIYFIGNIGLSRLALKLLESNADLSMYPTALKSHLYPDILLEQAAKINDFAKKYPEHTFSLMDLSDGLMEDLPRLIPNYGVEILLKSEDLHKEVSDYCQNNNINTLKFALKGGEDYALLGTCPDFLWEEFQALCSPSLVGNIIEKKGIFLNNKVLHIKSFDHFSKAKNSVSESTDI